MCLPLGNAYSVTWLKPFESGYGHSASLCNGLAHPRPLNLHCVHSDYLPRLLPLDFSYPSTLRPDDFLILLMNRRSPLSSDSSSLLSLCHSGYSLRITPFQWPEALTTSSSLFVLLVAQYPIGHCPWKLWLCIDIDNADLYRLHYLGSHSKYFSFSLLPDIPFLLSFIHQLYFHSLLLFTRLLARLTLDKQLLILPDSHSSPRRLHIHTTQALHFKFIKNIALTLQLPFHVKDKKISESESLGSHKLHLIPSSISLGVAYMPPNLNHWVLASLSAYCFHFETMPDF